MEFNLFIQNRADHFISNFRNGTVAMHAKSQYDTESKSEFHCLAWFEIV